MQVDMVETAPTAQLEATLATTFKSIEYVCLYTPGWEDKKTFAEAFPMVSDLRILDQILTNHLMAHPDT
jgi:hypothetical protein